MIDLIKQQVGEIDNNIKTINCMADYFRQLRRNASNKEIKILADTIIDNLNEEVKGLKCSRNLYGNILTKRRKLSRTQKSEESQNILQE